MSKQFRVHLYTTCHAKLKDPVGATTHQRAAQAVMNKLDTPYNKDPLSMADIFENRSASEYVEVDESGDIGFLVDRVEDDDFTESAWFTLNREGKVVPLEIPSRMFTQTEDQEIAKLKSLLHDIQHQLVTDTDLDNITGSVKYRLLSDRIKEILEQQP